MKRLLAVFTLSLLAAGPAAAKEVTRATVCGADHCREVKDRALLVPVAEGGDPTDPPKHATGWFRATLTVDAGGESHSSTIAVLPLQGYMRTYDSQSRRYMWMPLTSAGERAYRSITTGMKPLPVSELRGLDQEPIGAQVDEVVLPPEDDGSSFPIWIVVIVVAAAAAGLLLQARRRRTKSPAMRDLPNAPRRTSPRM